MITTFIILGIIMLIRFMGKIYLSIKFRNDVKKLLSNSKDNSDKVFQLNQLEGLPQPVQRYFMHVLKEGQPYIKYVRMTHDGQFKVGVNKNWVTIHGEQYAITQKPGFIWKGTTMLFTARDMYIEDKGKLMVTLFSLVNVVNGKGEQYNQGELIRWLAESVLYPTNLLPSQRLKWSEIDSETAQLTFNYNGLSLLFNVTFNQIGEITELETKRYMDKKHMETWVIKLANYKEINTVIVPITFEILWRLTKGDFSYAKFNMKRIEYNIPEKI